MVSLGISAVEEVLFWLLGSLSGAGWVDVVTCGAVCLVGLVVCITLAPALDAFAFGEDAAHAYSLLSRDVRMLVLPSPNRARDLNKAYRAIVDEQSYVRGRDAVWGLTDDQAWREVPPNAPTGASERPVTTKPRPWRHGGAPGGEERSCSPPAPASPSWLSW